jgi:membrane-bound lytic murein transglycosylase B
VQKIELSHTLGQNQFMPSTFNGYAVDYDQDGKKDIWSSKVDVWASIANYLQRHGWRRGAGWGFGVAASSVFPEAPTLATGCRALRDHSAKLTLSEWRSRGVDIHAKGQEGNEPYALIKPQVGDVNSYLVGGNFRTILSYNCANKYAVSVGLLADLITSS